MKLSIIIPVFNENETILKVIEAVKNVSLTNIDKEIIVVNDGSTDGTREKLEKNKINLKNIFIHHLDQNSGKGKAVAEGLSKATGDYVLIQDADLEYDPKDIGKLLSPLKEDSNIVVYGTRLKRLPNFSRDERSMRFFIHYLGNKLLSLLTSILYGSWITDMETGYKLFPKNALKGKTLSARGFDLEPEITARLLKSGYKIREIPISTNPRGVEEGKKLNAFKDGPVALWTLIKWRFKD